MDVVRPADSRQLVAAQTYRTLRVTLVAIFGIASAGAIMSGWRWWGNGDVVALHRFCNTSFLATSCVFLFVASFLTKRIAPIVCGLILACSVVTTVGVLATGSPFIIGIGVTLPIAGAIFLPERKWAIIISVIHIGLMLLSSLLIQHEWVVPSPTNLKEDLVYFSFIAALVTGCAVGLTVWLQGLSQDFVTIVDGSCDGLIYSDERGTVLRLVGPLFENNQRFRETWIGKQQNDIFEPHSFSASELGPRGILTAEVKVQGIGWVRVTRTEDPNNRGYVTTLKDIGKELAARQQLNEMSRMESLVQICGGLAHDFNNLLTVIGIYSETIESDSVRENILEAQRKACELTSGLLAFARQGNSDPEVVDLIKYLNSLAPVIESLVPANIELKQSLSRGPCLIEIDETQLQQIIINLINNSVDAMPRGGRLQISVDEVELDESSAEKLFMFPGGYVRLLVRDNGMGMSPDVRSKALEPFFTTKPRGEGTGIGLSTLHGTVTRAGGAIEIQSELGIGTAVQVFLPVAAEQKLEASKEVDASDCVTHMVLRILLVEDREALRGAMKAALESKGFVVNDFESAEPAIDVMQMVEFDVVITDIMLPRMSGFEFLQAVRKHDRSMKVILISGYHQEDLGTSIEDDEYAHFIQKPFRMDRLLTMIQDLNAKSLPAENRA